MFRNVSFKWITALILAASAASTARAAGLLSNLTASPPAIVDASGFFLEGQWYLNSDNGHVYYQYSNYPWEDRGPDSGPVGRAVSQANGPDVMVWNFSNLFIPRSARLTIVGTRPAVIMSPGSIVIDAAVTVDGGGGTAGGIGVAGQTDGADGAGASGGAGGHGRGGVYLSGAYAWGWDGAVAGGGGGGGFAVAGEPGANGHPVLPHHWDGNSWVDDPPAIQHSGGDGGAIYSAFSVLGGGGGGGAGGSGTTWGGYAAAGGNGGNGGGAVLFFAGGDFTITANGSIRADGNAAPYFDGGSFEASGGGGAGGYIAFNIAGSWQNDGTVSARGGAGTYNGGSFHPVANGGTALNLRDQMGGAGSGGYVAINPVTLVNTGKIDVSGGITAVSPVYGGRVLLDAPSIVNLGLITGATDTVATTAVAASALTPGVPRMGRATAANASATVRFDAPGNNGGAAITAYTVVSSPGGISASGTTSPITLTGLANGTSYTFSVTATNAAGTSAASAASNSVVPSTGPGAPTMGAATRGNASATVSFTAPTDTGGSTITAYTVSASPGGNAVSATTSPITVGGLTNGTAYTFTVTATNVNGTSAASVASNSITPATVPGAPNLATWTAGVGSGGVVVHDGGASVYFDAPWYGGSAITGYTLSCGGNTATAASSPISISGLTNGLSYTCSVAASNALGTGDASAAFALSPRGVPGAPTIGAASAGDASATVSFTAPTDTGGLPVAFYTVSASPGGFASSGTASPITVAGLVNGTAYTFKVTAANAAGIGASSADSNSVTPAAPLNTPSAPTITVVSIGNASVNINFLSPFSTGGSAITGYLASCQTSTGSSSPITASGIGSPILVTGLTNGTTYNCSVLAINAIGKGAATYATPVTPLGAPGAPTIGSAIPGNTNATISFAAPADDGGSAIWNYTVTSSPGGWVGIGTSSPITVNGLLNGIAYTFSVTATNGKGIGPASASSSTITPGSAAPTGLPGAPTITGVSVSSGNASITFTVPGSNGGSAITSYTATCQTATGGGSRTATGAGSPIAVTGLANGTTYICFVTAVNALGAGAAAYPMIVTPLAPVTTGGTESISFVTGWNLAGNGMSAALDVATAFGDKTKVTTVWKWIASKNVWAFYTPSLTGQALTDYALAKGYDLLATINAGEGCWVNALTPFVVSLSGTPVPASAFADSNVTGNALPAGWSLIAVGASPAPRDFVNTIATTQPSSPNVASTSSVTTLWAWNAAQTGWYFYAPSLENNGSLASYIAAKGYLDFAATNKKLNPSDGFWVNHP